MFAQFLARLSNLWSSLVEFLSGGPTTPDRTRDSAVEDDPTEEVIQGVPVPSAWEGPHGGPRNVVGVTESSEGGFEVRYTGSNPDRVRRTPVEKFLRWSENATRIG